MDRITSLERTLNPFTQSRQQYRHNTTQEFNNHYSSQRPQVYFGSGRVLKKSIITVISQ